jgi:GntR family transcriptional regulator, transcriptional repressor for pyruvate dehydrogenase complex
VSGQPRPSISCLPSTETHSALWRFSPFEGHAPHRDATNLQVTGQASGQCWTNQLHRPMIWWMKSSSVPLAPVERVDLFRQTIDRLAAFIDQNGLQAGDRLPGDRELASALHVSRPLVRQALKVLEGLGRVRAQQGLGTFVADNGSQVAANELVRGIELGPGRRSGILLARILVDSQVMRDGFREGGAELVGELRRVLGERRIALTKEPDEASYDLDFEETFARFCGNEVLCRLQAIIHEAWLQDQLDEGGLLADRFVLHGQHEAIVDRIEHADIDGAVALLKLHLGGLGQ